MPRPSALVEVERTAVWLVAMLAASCAVAWLAFGLQQEQIAPAVLFSLGVGATLGACEVALARQIRFERRRPRLLAAALWGLLAVVGQDYIGHRHRLASYSLEIGLQTPLAATTSSGDELRPRFWPYLFGVISSRPAWWMLDLLLTSAGTAAVIAFATCPDGLLKRSPEELD